MLQALLPVDACGRKGRGRSGATASALLVMAMAVLILPSTASQAQAPKADGGGVRSGTLPERWLLGGPECVEIPEFQIHEYNEDLYILRQSGCSNFEKPFLYLLFGDDKALLLDTGAGETNVAQVVRKVIDHWVDRNERDSIPLVVGHLHSHGDHTGGDKQLAALPNATLISPDLESVQTAFGFRNWPEEIAQYDLGGRVLDVIPIPGHDETSIAVYDRQTGILLTGDTLYPGRIYVNGDLSEFARSIRRLVEFTEGRIVAHVLGTHIENTRTPYLDYPIHTRYQPDEHALELGRGHLLELNDAVRRMNGTLTPVALRDFSVCGKYPNC